MSHSVALEVFLKQAEVILGFPRFMYDYERCELSSSIFVVYTMSLLDFIDRV